ncbi:DUF4124 domain-containing protein [Aestuariirhabdus sp. Z084]|uniref:DUF4124 domain-containing protein n=1 Tax=Aestuariirhabdus haliotis TaxID=2918751 RepID=UPI00201B370F|nr:DUF4124 domain-containing protein [Aestuariirhabdus haliotis]MCL6417330.1 DUF4124 domain-containing protein [Aestuariirhabdus haliotis]MCL6421275.1 DUF4124 domain-containing protein [Aestuariirhabdus haliotis]
MKKACFIIISALLTFASAQAATYYKWVDENGQTHFSATPPGNSATNGVEEIKGRSSSSSASNSAQASQPQDQSNPEAAEEEKASEEKFQQELAEAEASRKRNCETAKRNKVELTLKNRIKLLQDDGTYRTLSEDEKQHKIRQADEAIDTYCK